MRLYCCRGKADSLDTGYINFDSGGPAEDFHGNDQSEHIFLANEHAFDPAKETSFDSYPISPLQERMGLDSKGALDHLSNSIDLISRDTRRMPGPSHNVNYSRCAENLDLAIQAPPNKYIAREQRQPEVFRAVLPLVSRANKWEKDLMTLI
jgi:hypothetical protein